MKKSRSLICGICATSLFLSGTALAAKVINSIAAVVNDDVITEIEVTRITERKNRELKDSKQKVDQRKVINELVDDKLFNQLVADASIEVSEDDLARAIAGVLQENRISIDQLRGELSQKGMTFDEYKKDLEKEIKRIKYINQIIGPKVKISDQDLRDYYQKNQEQFRGRHSAHIAEIVLPVDGISTEAQFIEIKDLTLSIIAQARRGKSFTELAIKYSKGPNVEQGGDLGMMDLKDVPPPVAQAVRSMKVGDVSNPIFANNALTIAKLISLPEISAADFDKLRDDIYAALYDEKIEETFNSYMLQERQKAYINMR